MPKVMFDRRIERVGSRQSKATRLTFGFKYSAQTVTIGFAQEFRERGGSRILLRVDHHVSTQWR